MTTEERIKNRRIGIVGMARSGVASALLAQKKGGLPFVSDNGRAELLESQIQKLNKAGIPYETDGHTDRLLECDYIVISPGVPMQSEIVKKIRDAGLPIFSEVEFASWVCRGRIVAITGSNGKTTTTTLLGEILKAANFDTYVCGNIGLPFAEVVDEIPYDGIAVLEISNFQLETISDFKPYIAMILNLTPDHLDRHGTFEEYKRAKFRITENQTEADFLILNSDDPGTHRDEIKTSAKILTFSVSDNLESATLVCDNKLCLNIDGTGEEIISGDEIIIPGPHNLQNSAAAITVAGILGVSKNVMKMVLNTFPGVEHRMERVPSIAGINFINDSKATNVDSVCFALQSVETPIYLIAGGRGKGASYEPLIQFGKNKIKGIVAIGETREMILNALGQDFPVQFAESMEEAVELCFEKAYPGETVLLSPACASFDMFENFERRGQVFKKVVANLKNGKTSKQKN